jgi:hypothetical protein
LPTSAWRRSSDASRIPTGSDATPIQAIAIFPWPNDVQNIPPQFLIIFPSIFRPNTQDGIGPHHPQQLGNMPMPPIASMPDNNSSSSPSSASAQFFHFPHQRFPAPLRMPTQNGLIQNQHPPFFGGPSEQNGFKNMKNFLKF